MSIYSGFSSRSLEENYNKTLYNLLYLFQYRLNKLFKNGKYSHCSPFHLAFTTMTIESFDDSKFLKYLGKIYKSMLRLESLKHLAPKFSMAIIDLIQTLNIKSHDDKETTGEEDADI